VRAASALFLIALAAGCAARPTAIPLAGPGLRVDPKIIESSSPALVSRLARNPHGYFRFINREVAHLVCQRFAAEKLPQVTLHGDAHLEQYALTELGRGLTDFDDGTRGPMVIDLARFGTSLELVSRIRGWPGRGLRAFDRCLAGYRAALRDPDLKVPVPSVASRLMEGFTDDRQKALDRSVALVAQPLEVTPAFAAALGDYSRGVRLSEPDLAPGFFVAKSLGELRLGIGSALDRKYLARTEGPTSASDDDVLLEIKEVRDLSAAPCLQNGHGAGRVLTSHSVIPYAPFLYPGGLEWNDTSYWVHAWTLNYRELVIEELRSADEMDEVAYEVGAQLGRGHVLPTPHRLEREAILAALAVHEPELKRTVHDLADATEAAWRRFVEECRRLGVQGLPPKR
jgi:hypothetical protein